MFLAIVASPRPGAPRYGSEPAVLSRVILTAYLASAAEQLQASTAYQPGCQLIAYVMRSRATEMNRRLSARPRARGALRDGQAPNAANRSSCWHYDTYNQQESRAQTLRHGLEWIMQLDCCSMHACVTPTCRRC
jgi:hypothetical protein